MIKPYPILFPVGESVVVKHIKNQPLLFEWHRHDCFELILTIGARGTRFIGHNTAPFYDVDLALIAPDIAHTWDHADPQKCVSEVIVILWKKSLFDVNIAEYQPIQQWLSGVQGGRVFGHNAVASIKEKMHGITASSGLGKLHCLSEILNELRVIEPVVAYQNAEIGQQERINKIKAMLNQNVTDLPTLSDCAAQFHLSPATLKRLFNSQLNMSYSAYCAKLKLDKIHHLLATTSKPIGVIAQLCGFKNSASFNQFFSRHSTQTPSEFRKKHAWRRR